MCLMALKCPNCNGHLVDDEVVRLKVGTSTVKTPLTTTNKVVAMVVLPGTGMALGMYFVRGGNPVGALVGGALGLALAIVAVVVYSRDYSRQTAEHHYSCLLCGFKWTWREDRLYPYPVGTQLAPNAEELRRLGEARFQEIHQNAGYFIIQQRDHPNG